MTQKLLEHIISAISGGVLVAVVNGVFGRGKLKADATDINVKTAIELERVAMKRYSEADDKLALAYRILDDVKKDNEILKSYIEVLKDLLIKNNIKVPPMERK